MDFSNGKFNLFSFSMFGVFAFVTAVVRHRLKLLVLAQN